MDSVDAAAALAYELTAAQGFFEGNKRTGPATYGLATATRASTARADVGRGWRRAPHCHRRRRRDCKPIQHSAAPGTTSFRAVPDEPWAVRGYVKRTDLYGHGQLQPPPDTMNVYANDGETIVGHMYAEKGFVALHEDPRSIPTIPCSAGTGTEPRVP
jgi:hypothetical protein